MEFTPSQHKWDVMLKKKTSLFEVFASDNDVKMIDIKISSKSQQKNNDSTCKFVDLHAMLQNILFLMIIDKYEIR